MCSVIENSIPCKPEMGRLWTGLIFSAIFASFVTLCKPNKDFSPIKTNVPSYERFALEVVSCIQICSYFSPSPTARALVAPRPICSLTPLTARRTTELFTMVISSLSHYSIRCARQPNPNSSLNARFIPTSVPYKLIDTRITIQELQVSICLLHTTLPLWLTRQ